MSGSDHRWICPSDRELTLRAKLHSGWSSKTNVDRSLTSNGDGGCSINESEQAVITRVLERAARFQNLEQERIRKLNERLEKIRKQACGDGKKSCILCSEVPGFFSRFNTCKDCKSIVCVKCSVDMPETGKGNVCKICFESRELFKKSNLWISLSSSWVPGLEAKIR